MDIQDLINKLNSILANAKSEADEFVKSSSLPVDQRFEVSRSVECSALRSQITQLTSDLEALEELQGIQ
ncbi:hypothetical protein L1D54_23625 [Vibrio brasiliensis]|uniref:hypothetical protein n=1 Tax=Vibrio brasiliensis TaxID=170652 RepID=UPI001EFDDB7E|nr:hypothetical protein [Vibrio brasiliensis]MCG9753432.1 hypothetical protein [Vibrio brasiliensis]